jgi:membrane-associated phospholipid phosphatase/tRNA A-37 threonylcarbamoyl transferase component Bud32
VDTTRDQGGASEGEQPSRLVGALGSRRQLHLGSVTLTGRRRRPSGERPPLPRELSQGDKLWIVVGLATALLWVSLFAFPATTDFWTRVDHRVLNWFVDHRTDPMTGVMHAIHAIGSFWFIRPLRWTVMLVLIAFRRFRILFGTIVSFAIVDALLRALTHAIGRPRPFVVIIGDWSGYSHPSAPVALLAVTFVVTGLALIPKGRWRTRWFALTSAMVGLVALARVYLGVDHPTDVIVGWVVGPVVGVLVFRWLAPEAVFPVTYRRGPAAHLDVGGRRGEAIKRALREQLGIEAVAIEPFGQEGSGGSTPLRITCDEPDGRCYLFAKLYARSHLRADRWYKAARTILYGSLEDEVHYTSVRRLVEYEDYMLLKMRDADLPSPQPYGFVEITPEREYLIVTEFLEGAVEMGKADVTDEVIDDALSVSRRMWDAGLAHRDIKPANVMVRQGRIVLIDPAFATVRPTPWRQAVDLANMLIILGLRSSAERVYERALHFFAPEDLAEAFAATRGVTIPSQSRSSLALLKRTQGIDLVKRFRELAPAREPISIQRWSLRRVGLALVALLGLAVLLGLIIDNLRGLGFV